LCFIPNKLAQALPQQQKFAIKTPAMLAFLLKRKVNCVPYLATCTWHPTIKADFGLHLSLI